MPRLDEQEKDTVAVLACRKSDNITAQLVRKILSVERVDHIQQQVMRQADHSALLSKGAVKQKSHLHGGHADVSFGMKIQNIV